MASLFVEQGDAMNTTIAGFKIPPASMSAFDILSVAFFILFYRQLLTPVVSRLRKDPNGLTELQHMGIGLIIAIAVMVAAGTVEALKLNMGSPGEILSEDFGHRKSRGDVPVSRKKLRWRRI